MASLPSHHWRSRKRMKLPLSMSTITKKLFIFLFYKHSWLLWFFLSICLLTSYHLSSTTTINRAALVKPATSSALLARTLVEEAETVRRLEYDELDGVGLKVYVYELPAEYNADWLVDERCSRHLFAAEVAIHRALAGSRRFRTLDPYEADFFFVPVYVSCNFSTPNGFPALGHARSLLGSAVRRVSSEFPFWNRSAGADHVFVASHDYGACFHAMEDVAMADGIPSFLKNSIILQTFGVDHPHPCQDVEHVLIPPYVSPESIAATLEESPAGGERDIWTFFRGKMEVHPKNISGRFYSRRVRTAIWHRFNRHPRFYLRRKRFAGYQSEIARSVFCLCPLGWAPWSPRLVESVALGCVPIIVADGIRLPFPEAIPWHSISLSVPESDVGRLDRILDRVGSGNLSALQRNLADPAVRQALLFNPEIRLGDATWQVLVGLSKKLDRSFRRRGSATWR